MAIPFVQLLLEALKGNEQLTAAQNDSRRNGADDIFSARNERQAAQGSVLPQRQVPTITQNGMQLPGDAMSRVNQVFNRITSKYGNRPVTGGGFGGIRSGGV
jgi:hypothetical protein